MLCRLYVLYEANFGIVCSRPPNQRLHTPLFVPTTFQRSFRFAIWNTTTVNYRLAARHMPIQHVSVCCLDAYCIKAGAIDCAQQAVLYALSVNQCYSGVRLSKTSSRVRLSDYRVSHSGFTGENMTVFHFRHLRRLYVQCTGWYKKLAHFCTPYNFIKLSHFFHCQNRKKIWIIGPTVTPQMCHYTTLWNVNVLKQR